MFLALTSTLSLEGEGDWEKKLQSKERGTRGNSPVGRRVFGEE